MKLFYILFWFIFLLFVATHPSQANESSPSLSSNEEQGISFFTFFDIGNVGDIEHTINQEEFAAIIDELSHSDITLMPVEEALLKIGHNHIIEEPSVVLTFDGGYRSFYENAWPLIRDRKMPITLFITPDQISRQSDYFMNWKELKDVSDHDFVTIGLQADSYLSYTERDANEIRAGLNRAIGEFEENLGFKPFLIAYPYGLYDEKTLAIIKEYDFIQAGFGLQSAVAWHQTPLLMIPRFPMAGEYGQIDRFRMLAKALPLPVTDIVPGNTTHVSPTNPVIGFSLPESLESQKETLSCFVSDIGRIEPEFLGEKRIEIRLPHALQEKRYRINCTIPYISPVDGNESWRWFGMVVQPDDMSIPSNTNGPEERDFTSMTTPVLP